MAGGPEVPSQLPVEGGFAQRQHGPARRGHLPRHPRGLVLRHHPAQQPVEQGLPRRNGLPGEEHLQGHLWEGTGAVT